LGFQPDNIVLLLNGEATRERVVAEFLTLVKKAEKEPAFFYFGGYRGAEREKGASKGFDTLVCANSRFENVDDLRLMELASAARNANNLVTMVDGRTSFTTHEPLPERHIAVPAVRELGSDELLEASEALIPVGATSLYAGGWEEDFVPCPLVGEIQAQVHGLTTYTLLKALEENDPETLTYDGWVRASDQHAPSLFQRAPLLRTLLRGIDHVFLFDPRLQREAVLGTATRIEMDAVYRVIELLRRQIGGRNQQGAIHPDGWLSLGVAFGVVGDYEQALAALEAAVAATTPAKMEMNQVAAHGVTPEEIAPQISYHLGRLLLAAQTDFSRAVSELKKATQQDPGNARAWYYLGQAIRERIRRETLAEVESAFSAYLAAGAPVGHRREVVGFLRERTSSKADLPAR
jgi:hypothetical protein